MSQLVTTAPAFQTPDCQFRLTCISRAKGRFANDRAEDGTEFGDCIPGSILIRDFCRRCHTPMRASATQVGSSWCERCDPRAKQPDTRPYLLDNDAMGYQTVAIRAMEDG